MGAWAKKRAIERAEWEPVIRAGATVSQLAAQRGVSRQRISQKLQALGLSELYQSLQGISRAQKHSAREDEEEANCMKRWGCDLRTRREINRERAGVAYTRQRENAKRRGIAWDMSLGQWWEIWQKSGQWKNRGIYKGQYCMSRLGDVGPYSPENVAIIPNADNAREARSHAKEAPVTGVYCVRPGSSKPWAVYAKRKMIGYFESEEKGGEARARHLQELQVASRNV